MSEIEAMEMDCETAEYPDISIPEICTALENSRNTLIISHVNPDGDTIGSAFALKTLLCAMGKTASCVCSKEPAKRLHFLYYEQDNCEYNNDADEYDLILTIDVASPVQLGELDFLIPKINFMIDHHGMGEPFAPKYIDDTASAAGEIVFSIYNELKKRGTVGILPDTARRIYAAIVSDTGSFKFSNTTPFTHHAAAELIDEINSADDGKGDSADVCRSLFGQRTLKELTAQMLAIQNLKFYSSGELGAVIFTQQMLSDAGLTEDEIGNVVDTPRGVEGVLVGISLKQSQNDLNVYKVSSRANVECDVAAVCAKFGGGGHVRAAGCTITADSPEEALAIAADAFTEAINCYKAQKNTD